MPGLRAQLSRAESFLKTQQARIAFAAASRRTFSSTSLKLTPCLSVNLGTDKGWRGITVPVGTSAGKNEPSSITPKGQFQTAEKDTFERHIQRRLLEMPLHPLKVDRMLEEVNASLPPREDGIDTPFSRIGGPTATATSLASVLCFAQAAGISDEAAIHYLYNQIAAESGLPPAQRLSLPVYMSKIVDGGVHGALDKKERPLIPIQEFLFVPIGYSKYTDALEAILEVNTRFYALLRERNFEISMGAEAGIVSPQLTSSLQVLRLMSLAIRGNETLPPLPGMLVGLDVAASEIYGHKEAPEKYYLGKDGRDIFGTEYVDFKQLTLYYEKLKEWFPIVSIEDPYAEEAVDHWRYGFSALGEDVLIITDDATVTQPNLVKEAVKWGTGGLLTKVNQGGTFSRTALAMALAANNNWARILSHRSSEAADFVFEAMMAVATGAEFLKVTVGSTQGGGGGREARVNWVSNANVVWNALEDEGLPYQGQLMMTQESPPPWLKRTQILIGKRYDQAEDAKRTGTLISQYSAYRFGSDGTLI